MRQAFSLRPLPIVLISLMRLQVCYRLYPHQKKNDYEKLIEDLKSQKEQLERERGNQFTENDILEFVADLLQGDPADKDYQKKLIDNLVVKVFVGDGYITAHIKPGNATEVADIRLEEVKKAFEHIFNCVQTLSPLAQRKGFEPLDTFLHHTISNRARSTAPPSLQLPDYFTINRRKKQSFFPSFTKMPVCFFRPALFWAFLNISTSFFAFGIDFSAISCIIDISSCCK